MSTTTYDAFISYSHRTGGVLGPALRDAFTTSAGHGTGCVACACSATAAASPRTKTSGRHPDRTAELGDVRPARVDRERSLAVGAARAGGVAGEDATAPNPDRRDRRHARVGRRGRRFRLAADDCAAGLPARLVRRRAVVGRPATLVAAAHGRRGYSTSDPLFLDAVATIASAVQHRPKNELIETTSANTAAPAGSGACRGADSPC